MKTKFLAQLLLSTCLISSCTSEDLEFSDVDEQGSIETTTLDIDEAKSLLQEFVADAFTKSNTSFTIKEHKLKTLYIDNTETLPVTVRDTIPVYEFTTETDGQEGYSVVVGDKRVEKVLISVPSGLLSDTSFIEPLRLYYRDIPMLIQQDLNQYYAETQEKAIQTKMSVEACYKDLPTLWSQGYPYNEKCPIKCYDHALAGCNAIAIAQILAYHRVPTNLNWNAILASSTVTSSSSATVIDQVSTLIANIGSKISTEYECLESGASPSNIPSCLISYGLKADGIVTLSVEECKMNLQNGRPAILFGYTASNAGHTWVCDGWKKHIYDDGNCYDYLKMNWGWGGDSNGFFLIEYPMSFNAGGYLFNKNLKMICNIHKL